MAEWPTKDSESAIAMRDSGATYKQISEDLGRTLSAVESWFRRQKKAAKKSEPAKTKKSEEIAAAAMAPQVNLDKDQMIRDLEKKNAILNRQLTWAQHAKSGERTGGVFTLRASDHHFGDANHLLSCCRSLEAKAVEVIKQYEPQTIHIVAGDDWVAGRGIYREQDLDSVVQDVNQQCELGAMKARQFLIDIRKVSKAPITWHIMRGNHDYCLSEDTEVLTDRGWLHYVKLRPQDKALSINPETHRAEWCEILNVYECQPKTMHHIKAKQIDVLCTTNHRHMLASFRHDHSKSPTSYAPHKYRFVTTEELPSGGASIPVSAPCGMSDTEILTVSDGMLKVLAWVQTDGWIDKGRYIRIQQNECKVHLITQSLDEAGLKYSVSHRKPRALKAICGTMVKTTQPSCVVHVLADSSRQVLGWLPHGKKKLPKLFWRISRRQFQVFLDTVLDGDGTRTATGRCVYGTKAFLDQLQPLCIAHGVRANIREYRPGSFRLDLGYRCWGTYRDKAESITPVSYTGTAWCIQTKHGNFAIRRNGIACFTGNSNGHSLTEFLHLLLAKVNEDLDEVDFVMHWDRIIHNMSDKGTYNTLIRHGFGYSKLSPNSPAFISAVKDEMLGMQRSMQPHEHIRRVLSGHTHWISVGLEHIVGLYFDTTGGLQRNTRVRLGANQRPSGWICYVSPRGMENQILEPIQLVPDEDTYKREISDPYLALSNTKDAAETIRAFYELMRAKGSYAKGSDYGVVNEGRW